MFVFVIANISESEPCCVKITEYRGWIFCIKKYACPFKNINPRVRRLII